MLLAHTVLRARRRTMGKSGHVRTETPRETDIARLPCPMTTDSQEVNLSVNVIRLA